MFLGSLMSPSPQWHLPPDLADGAKNGTWVWLILPIFRATWGAQFWAGLQASDRGWLTSPLGTTSDIPNWYIPVYRSHSRETPKFTEPLPVSPFTPPDRDRRVDSRRGSQPSPWVGPGKPNLPLGLRGKAGGGARVTAALAPDSC